MTMTFEQMQELISQTLEITHRNSVAIASTNQELRETRTIVDQNAQDIRKTEAIATSVSLRDCKLKTAVFWIC